jgi:hypothetical protein
VIREVQTRGLAGPAAACSTAAFLARGLGADLVVLRADVRAALPLDPDADTPVLHPRRSNTTGDLDGPRVGDGLDPRRLRLLGRHLAHHVDPDGILADGILADGVLADGVLADEVETVRTSSSWLPPTPTRPGPSPSVDAPTPRRPAPNPPGHPLRHHDPRTPTPGRRSATPPGPDTQPATP